MNDFVKSSIYIIQTENFKIFIILMRLKLKKYHSCDLKALGTTKISLQLLYKNNTVETALRGTSLQWPLMTKSRMVAISEDLTEFDSLVSDKIQVLAKMPPKQHNDNFFFFKWT